MSLGQRFVDTEVTLQTGSEMSDRVRLYLFAGLAFDVQSHRVFQRCLEISPFRTGYPRIEANSSGDACPVNCSFAATSNLAPDSASVYCAGDHGVRSRLAEQRDVKGVPW